jgi:hypothetical protein
MGSISMAQTTEAACLLQSGAMYPRRIGLRTASGLDLFAGVKPGGVSVYFGDAPIYHFDLDGRWQRAYVDGVHYLKGLDATVRSIDREREGGSMVLRRQTLPYVRSVDLDASIRSVVLELIGDLDSGRLEVLPTPPRAQPFEPEDFRGFLERVAGWDNAAWFAHRERYLATYGPIPFLPPDCPNALVLQATLGHVDGRDFGRGRPAEHYVRSLDEFSEHCQAVAGILGRRVAQCRGVFLGGADVLHRPVAEVVEILKAIERCFPIGERATRVPRPMGRWDDVQPDLGLVHVFLDDFAGPLPDREGWRRLKAAKLGRVSLGVESGDLEIRTTYGKSWNPDDLRGIIADLKASEIGVGLVVLVGAGGRSMADRHLAESAALLGSLPLEAGDLVSLVDVRSLDESPVDSLNDDETAAQISALKQLSAAARPSKGPKLVAYNPDKQWT